jgi:tRNA U34 5-carboxymethylaminomethyl modifying GTPase MnmE/TrmE
VTLAKDEIARADLVAWVLDAGTLSPKELSDPPAAAERQIVAELGEPPASWFAVVNKRDLAAEPIAGDGVTTCALTGAGVDGLLAVIAKRLVPVSSEPGDAIPFTQRHVDLLRTAARQLNERDLVAARGSLSRFLRFPPLEGEC